ncbi:MAG TPA: hypothetical protein VGH79_04800 [Gaiellaceae bacterium]|jgi:hypothetical protein
MRNRRFLLLAAALVTLNAVLWLAPGALGITQGGIASLFGGKMVRATVLENSGAQWNVDRGIVVTNLAGTLTLKETDSKVQPITTSSATKVTAGGVAFKLKNIKPGWRVLVVWPPTGPAQSVVVEKRSS